MARCAHVVHEQRGRALAAEGQGTFGVDDAVDVVDEIEVLVEQQAAAEPGDGLPRCVAHSPGGEHHQRAVFGLAGVGCGVAGGHERNAQAGHEVGRQRGQGLGFQLHQARARRLVGRLQRSADGRRHRGHRLCRIAGAQARRCGARQGPALQVVQHQKVQPQLFPGPGELFAGEALRHGAAGAQCRVQGLRFGHAAGARSDFAEHLVEVAVGHREVAAHLGDQQPVVGRVAPQCEGQRHERKRHQQRQ